MESLVFLVVPSNIYYFLVKSLLCYCTRMPIFWPQSYPHNFISRVLGHRPPRCDRYWSECAIVPALIVFKSCAEVPLA
jgi:hypothetical protein